MVTPSQVLHRDNLLTGVTALLYNHLGGHWPTAGKSGKINVLTPTNGQNSNQPAKITVTIDEYSS
jgi:hypothetical protein